ncbi:hypothetical protein Ocin01_06791 [Orchesella cincta]|uniref:Uncharacterized protein n=1 Tax=Orchesella cincta TaxID=48709 RepID=A0A1D2N3T0_ORCCI|nr:hypothetical protein Ocin01_06791 [Orchesella cincta]
MLRGSKSVLWRKDFCISSLVGLVAAICVVGTWGLSAYVMYNWMHQQSGHGVRFVNNKNKENDIMFNKQGNQQAENVVKKMGVM